MSDDACPDYIDPKRKMFISNVCDLYGNDLRSTYFDYQTRYFDVEIDRNFFPGLGTHRAFGLINNEIKAIV